MANNITGTIYEAGQAIQCGIDITDLAKEEAIGVVLSVYHMNMVQHIQLDLLEAAEVVARLTNAIRTQYEAMGCEYVRP